jgi:hypothetical protein
MLEPDRQNLLLFLLFIYYCIRGGSLRIFLPNNETMKYQNAVSHGATPPYRVLLKVVQIF